MATVLSIMFAMLVGCCIYAYHDLRIRNRFTLKLIVEHIGQHQLDLVTLRAEIASKATLTDALKAVDRAIEDHAARCEARLPIVELGKAKVDQ